MLTDLMNLVDGNACWAEVPHVCGEGHKALQRADLAPEVAVAAEVHTRQILSTLFIFRRNVKEPFGFANKARASVLSK